MEALLVVHCFAVTGKTNEVGESGVSDFGDAFRVNLHERIVMFETVEGFADPADVDALGGLGGRVADHRTKEAVFLEGGEIFRLEQINCDEAHFFPSSAKGIEVDLGPTPFASRLAERVRRRGRGGGGFGSGVSGP